MHTLCTRATSSSQREHVSSDRFQSIFSIRVTIEGSIEQPQISQRNPKNPGGLSLRHPQTNPGITEIYERLCYGHESCCLCTEVTASSLRKHMSSSKFKLILSIRGIIEGSIDKGTMTHAAAAGQTRTTTRAKYRRTDVPSTRQDLQMKSLATGRVLIR
jgi:hypothetical protein